MKKKLLGVMAMSMAVMGAQNVKAQTDVTAEYLVNPSFETLKATDGNADVTVKNNLTNGLYGWILPDLGDSFVNYNLESAASGSNSGFVDGKSVTPTDGTYYYFNRRGWANIDSELKTSTSKALEPGIYYVTVDYKAAEFANTSNNPSVGTSLGITVTDAFSNTLGVNSAVVRAYSVIYNDGGELKSDLLAVRPWDTIGAFFSVDESSTVTIALQQKMKGGNGRSDIMYDNMRLYKYEDNSSSMNISGLLANANDYLLAGWSIEGGDTYHVNTWSTEGNSDGSEMKTPFIEDWVGSGNKLKDAVISQTLTGLVPGKYKATVLVRVMNEAEAGSEITGAVLYANDKEINVCNGTPTTTGYGKYGTYSLDFEVGMSGDMEIGFKIQNANFNWIAFKNFQLEFVAPLTAEDLLPMLDEQLVSAREVVKQPMNAEVKSSLTVAISNGEAIDAESSIEDVQNALSSLETAVKNANASIAEYASFKTDYDKAVAYVSERVIKLDDSYDEEAYEAAIADVEARYNNGTLGDADEEVMNIYKALSAAAASQEYKAGVDYSYAILNNSFETGDLTGWALPVGGSQDTKVTTSTGDYVTAGIEGNYLFNTWWTGVAIEQTISGLPAGKYTLSALYASDKNNSGSYLVVNDVPSQLFQCEAGKGQFMEVAVEFELSENQDLNFFFQGAKEDGSYEKYVSWLWYKADNFRLTPVVETVNVSVSEAGWATMILPFAAAVPEGMTVYSCGAVDENNILTLNEVNTIEANVPYIIASEPKYYVFEGANTAKESSYTSGLLTGVYAEDKAPVGSYVLQNQTDGVAFYKVEDGAQPAVKANRAYLTLSGEAGVNVRAVYFPNSDATGVESVDAADVMVDVYTMSGIRVRSNVKKSEALNGLKGVYILKAVK